MLKYLLAIITSFINCQEIENIIETIDNNSSLYVVFYKNGKQESIYKRGAIYVHNTEVSSVYLNEKQGRGIFNGFEEKYKKYKQTKASHNNN
jgi:hypothetical protein